MQALDQRAGGRVQKLVINAVDASILCRFGLLPEFQAIARRKLTAVAIIR